MIVAIDGPAGAGKSTAAAAAARALGYRHLDTGAMYRCVALASLEDPRRSPGEHAAALDCEIGERVLLRGRDVTREIRSPRVSERASEVAADPEVRRALVARQRATVAGGDWVVEGRDIGTVVAPCAEVKVFLVADDAVRAQRRAHELGAAERETLAAQRDRDTRDSGRAHSPLEPAADAVLLDTTALAPGEVVERIVALARSAERPSPALGG
jgi:cytidylate kinase